MPKTGEKDAKPTSSPSAAAAATEQPSPAADDSDDSDAVPVPVARKRSRGAAAPSATKKAGKRKLKAAGGARRPAARKSRLQSRAAAKRARLAGSDDSSDGLGSSSSSDGEASDSSGFAPAGASSSSEDEVSLESEAESSDPGTEDSEAEDDVVVKAKPAPRRAAKARKPAASPVVASASSPSVAASPAGGVSAGGWGGFRSGAGGPLVSGIASSGAVMPTKKETSTVLPAGTHQHHFYQFLQPDQIKDKKGRRPGDDGYNPHTLYVPPSFKAKESPAMQQWWDFKSNSLDTVLFFKVGKFYELYHMDADIGVSELDMVYMKGAYAHAGFPEIAYGKWSEILVSRGYKVARVEQTQTPAMLKETNAELRKAGKKAEKVVARELCSVKTKGTVTGNFMDHDLTNVTGGSSSKTSQIGSPAYLLGIVEVSSDVVARGEAAASTADESGTAGATQGSGNCEFGVCLVDAATSRVLLGQFTDDRQRTRLRTLLAEMLPVEVVLARDSLTEFTLRILRNDAPGAVFSELAPGSEFWGAEKTVNKLLRGSYFDEAVADKSPSGGSKFDLWPPALKRLCKVSDDGEPVALPSYELAVSALGGVTSYLAKCHIAEEILSHRMFAEYSTAGATGFAVIGEDEPTCTTAGTEEKADGGAGRTKPAVEPEVKPRMVLDGSTLVNLEILQNSFDGGIAGTLMGVIIGNCHTPFGRRVLRDWMCRPLQAAADINERLDAVENLMAEGTAMSAAAKALSKLPDLEHLLARIHSMGSKRRETSHPDARAIFYEAETYSKSKIQDLSRAIDGFKTAKKAIDRFVEYAEALKSPLLRELVESATERDDGLGFPDLTEAINFFENAYDQDEACRKGVIEPIEGVNPEYDEACRRIASAKTELDNYLSDQRAAFGTSAVKYFGRAKDRYQLEIPEKALSRKGVPDSFELKSQRKTGKDGGVRRFWSPTIVEHFEELQRAESDRDDALKSQLRVIMARFDRHRALWVPAVRCIANLDALMSLAAWSSAKDDQPRVRPQFVPLCSEGGGTEASAHPFVSLKGAWHPCVHHTFSGGSYIANDTSLGVETKPGTPEADGIAPRSCMLLTGPNMGGKSTLLRQTCVAVILAQMGAYVPAEQCRMTPMDRIFTRVGASDRILAGQSTFFVELAETSAILRYATPRSLVILDELGRGTSTFDGNAIAYAVVKHLTRNVGACTMFATHYHSLIEEFEHDRAVQLSHMRCLVEDGEDGVSTVTFLYKLAAGACPKSYGMNVARLAHLPEDVVKRAAAKSAEFEAALEQVRSSHYVKEAATIVKDAVRCAAEAAEGDALLAAWERARGMVTTKSAADDVDMGGD